MVRVVIELLKKSCQNTKKIYEVLEVKIYTALFYKTDYFQQLFLFYDPSINRYYRNVDFAEEKLREYMKNLENEIIKKYVELKKEKNKID